MNITPVQLLGARHPEQKEEISKISKKWNKRTKKLDQGWPEGGTFDCSTAETMECRIKDYKPTDKTKKRQQKREKELQILSLFKTEGENYRKTIKKARESLNKKAKNQPKHSGIYPLLTGSVQFTGNFDTDEKEKTTINPITPNYCSTAKKPANKKGQETMNCYADKSTALNEMKNTYWYDLELSEDETLEVTRTRIQELVKNIGLQLEQTQQKEGAAEPTRDAQAEGEAGPSGEEKKGFDTKRVVGGCLMFETNNTGEIPRDAYGLRDRNKLQNPVRYPDKGQYPILIKGKGARYIPWQTADLEGLVARLPDIHEGANKWIRVFEEETMGKMLAVGDIKALWARTLGIQALENIVRTANLERMKEPDADGTEFNPYRPRLWEALRKEYPVKIDPKALKGEPLPDTENPSAYISRQLKKWKQETEEDVINSPLLTALFRTSIVEAMPSAAKSRLEEVVGLESKSHREFCDHVTHAVERQRKEEKKLKDQEREIQRKVTQLQLNELTNKNKKKTQAPVMNQPNADMTTQAFESEPTVAPAYELNLAPTTRPPMQPTTPPTPVVNVFTQQPQQQGHQMRRPGPMPPRRQQGGRPMGRPGNPQAKMCWGCQQAGHIRENCPMNPWPASNWQDQGPRGRPYQGMTRRQVNPWVGPKHGY